MSAWEPIAGTVSIVVVAAVAFGCALRWRAFRTDKTALAWLLCAPAIAHIWGEFGGESVQHTWIELALGVVPWYLIVEARLVQLDPHWFKHKRGLAFTMAHLIACLVFVPLAVVLDTVLFEPLVLLVACVPPTALVLVETLHRFRDYGHTRDALIAVTTAVWIAHLAPETRGLLAIVHPLVLVRICWPTKRAEHESWFFQVSELSAHGVLALLVVAEQMAVLSDDEEEGRSSTQALQKAWRTTQAWQQCKARHASSANYDRLQRDVEATLGLQAESEAMGPERARLRIRQTVHERHGSLLRKPVVQLAVRDWLRNTAHVAALPEVEDTRGLLMEERHSLGSRGGARVAINLDSDEGTKQVAERLRQELKTQDSSSSESSSGSSSAGEVVYGSFNDLVTGRVPEGKQEKDDDDEDDNKRTLTRSNSLLERLARERREFMASSEQSWYH